MNKDQAIKLLDGHAFQEVMKDEFARKQCWSQLEKDVRMSGMADFPEVLPADFQGMVDVLSPWIEQLKARPRDWNNLNYRIDLPLNIDANALKTEAYAHLILLRSYQKSWLRAHFSKGGDSSQAEGIQKLKKS